MAVESLSDVQLQSLIDNYRRNGVTEGGTYPLGEALLEQRRRVPTPVPIATVFDHILALSAQSPDGLLTYGDLWKVCFPGKPWVGNAPRAIVAKLLYRVIGYCVDKGTPIITTLVVRKSPRRLDPSAVKNIYEECREFGVDVGDLGPEKFCELQAIASRELAATRAAG